ncbi:hypothetical protein HMPREF0658_0413 [Hoylesella marshii DSM 16973 = JCM 13450]|uniref:Uncharacterized protein n=1 Tax=Hoylesella marshii DSM 16973 = JCM 13450 TaxID=862515 RepID=E0NQG2_9BACT|nr:hypothetical protein HMPREF0658_0413 [Hoylesella marshii DSM 16973 = JCM 13450]
MLQNLLPCNAITYFRAFPKLSFPTIIFLLSLCDIRQAIKNIDGYGFIADFFVLLSRYDKK